MSELSQSSVILCHCQGQISNRLSLAETSQFLQRMAPGISVSISDNLCQTGALAQFERQRNAPLLVGACSELRRKYQLADSPPAVSIVNMLKESSAPYGVMQATERVKLLLWAQLRRMSQFTGLRQDKLKLQLTRPQGKFSRRELFGLFRAHHQVIPYINSARCLGSETCHICQDACPVQAVTARQNEAAIEQNLCVGCGGCVMACPQRAIVYPIFSLEQLDKEMEGLLFGETTLLEPRIIAFTCQKCPSAPDGDEGSWPDYPGNMLPVAVPCLTMASPWLILRACDLGAQGVVLISGKGKCPSGFDSSRWRGTIQFVQALLNCWGIEPQRLKAFEATEPEEMKQELTQFAQEVSVLPPTALKLCQPANMPADGLLLPALIKGMNDKLGPASTGVIAAGMVPLGRLELDTLRCTGCGICAASCPTRALTLSSGGEADSYQLLFQHYLCVACNTCLALCPEHCLRLERLVELDKLGRPPALLFQDSVVRCRQCSRAMGTQAMMNRLGAKVPEIAGIVHSQSELCPVCQVKAEVSSSMVST